MRHLLLTTLALTLGFGVAAPAASQGTEPGPVVMEAAAVLIEQRYVDRERGVVIARALRSSPAIDETDPEALARTLTDRLRQLSGDRHFAVEHRPARGASDAGEDEAAMMERWYGVGVNHGVQGVTRLEGGVGYLDLRAFAPLNMSADMIESAMTILAQSPALIIDLRSNSGGMGDTARLLMSYLFDDVREVSGVYNRPSDTYTRSYTAATVPGRRYGGVRPVYILISRRTFSAAENFAYDLQAMGRATIVGEATAGGAHPFEICDLPGDYVLFLPESRSVNPVTGGDWEGVGVRPDISVTADEALPTALRHALGVVTSSDSRR